MPMNPSEHELVYELPGSEVDSRPLSPWLRMAHRRTQTQGPTEAPLRRLRDFEFLLVLQGTPWLWVEPVEGALRLQPGSMVLIPPGIVHTWGETADSHIAIHFDLHAKPEIAPLDNLVVLERRVRYHPPRAQPLVRWPSFGGRRVPILQHLRDPTPWRNCFEELLSLSAGRTSAQLDIHEQLAVQEQLGWAVRNWLNLACPESQSNLPRQRVRDLLRRIDPIQPNHVEELAQRAQLSPTAFRIAFRGVTGESPRRWLEQRRVNLAAHRLLYTDLPVAAIAEEVGYPDPYHFSRVFKRVTGLPPLRYRRERRKDVL